MNDIDPDTILEGASDILLSSTSVEIGGADTVEGFSVALLIYEVTYNVEADAVEYGDIATVDVISKLNKPPERP